MPSWRAAVALGAIAAAFLLCGVAHAETRFALVIGHNVGTAAEAPLRWAEQDAERVARLLGQLGGSRTIGGCC